MSQIVESPSWKTLGEDYEKKGSPMAKHVGKAILEVKAIVATE